MSNRSGLRFLLGFIKLFLIRRLWEFGDSWVLAWALRKSPGSRIANTEFS